MLLKTSSAPGSFGRSIVGSYALQVAGVVLSLLLSILLARLLGPSGFGDYAYALNWVLVLSTLATLGMDRLVLREVASYSSLGQWSFVKGLIRWSQIRVFLFSLAVVGMVVLARRYFLPDFDSTAAMTLNVALLLIPLLTLTRIYQGALRGLRQIVQGQIADALVRPLLLLLFLLGGLFATESMGAPLAMGLHVVAAVFSLIFVSFLLFGVVRPKVDPVQAAYSNRIWWTITIPLLASALLDSLNQRTSVLMLGSMLDTEAAGIFNVAKRLAEPTVFVLLAVNTSLAPRVAGYFAKKQHEELQSLVTKSARIILLVSVPVALLIILVGPWLLLLWGPEFRSSYSAVVILILAQLVNATVGPVVLLLNMTNHERDVVMALAISTGATILLNYILIPKYGVNGAALATAISVSIWNLILVVVVRRRLGIDSTIMGRPPKRNPYDGFHE